MSSLRSTKDSSDASLEQTGHKSVSNHTHSARLAFAGLILGIVLHTGYKHVGASESQELQMRLISELSRVDQERLVRDKAVNCMSEYAVLNSHGGYFCKSGDEWYYVVYPYNGQKPTIRAVEPPEEKYLYEAKPVFQGEPLEF